jgi:hypothetical protein
VTTSGVSSSTRPTRRPRGELAVRLVDHQQPGHLREHGAHVGLRLDQTGGVVRRAEERHHRRRAGDTRCTSARSSEKSAARSPSATVAPVRWAMWPCNLVRGLEGGDGAAGAGEGEQQRLQHLVADPLAANTWSAGRRGARRCPRAARGRPIRVAVPLHPRQLGGERVAPCRRWRERRFVGVQPHVDLHLWGVVALEGAEVVADGHTGHVATLPTRRPRTPVYSSVGARQTAAACPPTPPCPCR